MVQLYVTWLTKKSPSHVRRDVFCLIILNASSIESSLVLSTHLLVRACMYACMRTCMFAFARVRVSTLLFIYQSVILCIYILMSVRVSVYLCIYVPVRISAWVPGCQPYMSIFVSLSDHSKLPKARQKRIWSPSLRDRFKVGDLASLTGKQKHNLIKNSTDPHA